MRKDLAHAAKAEGAAGSAIPPSTHNAHGTHTHTCKPRITHIAYAHVGLTHLSQPALHTNALQHFMLGLCHGRLAPCRLAAAWNGMAPESLVRLPQPLARFPQPLARAVILMTMTGKPSTRSFGHISPLALSPSIAITGRDLAARRTSGLGTRTKPWTAILIRYATNACWYHSCDLGNRHPSRRPSRAKL